MYMEMDNKICFLWLFFFVQYVYKSYVGSGGQVLSTDSQSTTTAVDSPTKGTYVLYMHTATHT